MPYRLSALAEQDLEEIWSYVAEDASPATADRLIDAIIDRFELLAGQPRMGRLRPEFGEGVRSLVVESYVIYYRHQGDVREDSFMDGAIRPRRGPNQANLW
jgi:toxin ParE1/3/4